MEKHSTPQYYFITNIYKNHLLITSEASARICLFGDHQDYLNLPVIAGTIDRKIKIKATPNSTTTYFLQLLDLEENITINEVGAIKINFESLKLLFFKSNLFGVKILGKVLQIVGGKEYSPKKRKTFNLMKAIFDFPFKSRNIGNVNIYLNKNYLFFIREQRNLFFKMKIKKNKYYIFDGRFLLISNVSGNLIQSNENYLNNVNEKSGFFKYKKSVGPTKYSLSTVLYNVLPFKPIIKTS